MIRLKTILTEIALNTVTPYATQIVWTDMHQAHSTYTAEVPCDGITVKLQIDRQRRFDGYIYQFSFFMPKVGGPSADGHQSYTTAASQSAGKGALNFLRVMMTCAYAIKDFTDTHDIEILTVTGGDLMPTKVAQKTRIYHELFAANAHMFPAYKIHLIGNELYLIKKSNADSTGIKDAT